MTGQFAFFVISFLELEGWNNLGRSWAGLVFGYGEPGAGEVEGGPAPWLLPLVAGVVVHGIVFLKQYLSP